jgi:hypothetical protein
MNKVIRYFWAMLVVMCLLPASALCADSNPRLSAEVSRQTKIDIISDLVQHRLITPEEGTKAYQFYTQQASSNGDLAKGAQVTAPATASERTEGFGVFLNTLIVFAGVALLLSVVGLILFYLRDVLLALPAEFYEAVSYLITGSLFVGCYYWRPFNIFFVHIQPLWFLVPAALAFAGCVYLSYALHWLRPSDGLNQANPLPLKKAVFVGPGLVRFHVVLLGLCALVWGALAVVYHHAFPDAAVPHFLAFIAVMALQCFLGFSAITVPGCILLGWTSEEQVPKSTLSSLILLVAYVACMVSGQSLPPELMIFERGCIFMGAFVYYLGLLVMSSKLYTSSAKSPQRYMLMQAITILSGIAAFYLGNSFHIPALLGIGGTFFTIYLLEKYYEIPWKGVGWAWSLLGVAAGLYFFVGFAGQHPQYFIWGIH